MKAFVAGLVIGGAVGWGAAELVRPDGARSSNPPTVAPAVVEPRMHARARSDEPRADPTPSGAPRAEEPPDDRSQIFAKGGADAIRKAMSPPTRLGDDEVAAVSARLAAAMEARDAELSVALFRVLGESRNPLGRMRLIELLGDPAVPLSGLKTGIYGDILRWLDDEDVPAGTGAAARRRLEAHVMAGDASSYAMDLTKMIALYGGPDELAWLATTVDSRDFGWATTRALTSVTRDETAPVVASLVAAGKLGGDGFVDYVRANPAGGWAVVAPLVAGLGVGSALPPGLDASTLLRAYGVTAPAEELSVVRDRLVALPTPELRVAALSTVQALADRKIDVVSFAPIIDAPLDLLAAPGEIDSARGHACMYGIQYHHVAWSTRAADALNSAAPRAGSLSKGFRDVAAEIRRELADPWRRK